MPARGFLLAAGFGTRLRPLTLCRPKPLTPVCGLPMLDYAAALCERHGIRELVVNAHHLPEQIEAWAAAHPLSPVVSVEQPDILGTGGGLKQAAPELAERFVVVNGDILSDVDLGALLAGLERADAVMALRQLRASEPYGSVLADGTGTVVKLVSLAEAAADGPVAEGTHFTGVHALKRSLVEALPLGEACIVRTVYKELVPQRRVGATRHSGTWFDVGTPQAYLRANMLAVAGQLALPVDPMEHAAFAMRGPRTWGDRAMAGLAGVDVAGPCWIGPNARIKPGAQIGPRAIIGAGAQVGRDAVVRDSVVWSGCTVGAGATLDHAIVYDSGVLHPMDRSSG